MKVFEELAQALVDQGVSTVFGLMGDGNLYAMDDLSRNRGARFIAVAHEAAAVLGAYGYAVISGELGVASTTHGPALTNTVTALVEATRAKIPLLLVVGDTPKADPQDLQNIDQRTIAESAGAGFEDVTTPESIVSTTARAISRAWAEQRPIVLNVPAEFMWLDVEAEHLDTVGRGHADAPDPEAVEAAAAVIASARRPLVLAGRGATAPGARAALLRLARRIGAPVATTLKARELFSGEPENLGIFGGLSHDVALETILASDCVIAFGARLNKYTLADGSLADGRAIIQVDVDGAALGRLTETAAAVGGDAADVAGRLVELLDEAEVPATAFVTDALLARLSDYERTHAVEVGALVNQTDETGSTSAGTVDLMAAMAKINSRFPAERTFVLDAGRFAPISFTKFSMHDPRAYVHTLHFGSIGLGMSAAVGAAVASPDRPTLFACGDGGFMLGGLGEFNTAVRYGLDIVVAVFNDGAYGAEHVQLVRKGMDPTSSTFHWPEFADVATAMGGHGIAIRSLAELDAALTALPDRAGPVLLDIKIDPLAVARATGALD